MRLLLAIISIISLNISNIKCSFTHYTVATVIQRGAEFPKVIVDSSAPATSPARSAHFATQSNFSKTGENGEIGMLSQPFTSHSITTPEKTLKDLMATPEWLYNPKYSAKTGHLCIFSVKTSGKIKVICTNKFQLYKWTFKNKSDTELTVTQVTEKKGTGAINADNLDTPLLDVYEINQENGMVLVALMGDGDRISNPEIPIQNSIEKMNFSNGAPVDKDDNLSTNVMDVLAFHLSRELFKKNDSIDQLEIIAMYTENFSFVGNALSGKGKTWKVLIFFGSITLIIVVVLRVGEEYDYN